MKPCTLTSFASSAATPAENCGWKRSFTFTSSTCASSFQETTSLRSGQRLRRHRNRRQERRIANRVRFILRIISPPPEPAQRPSGRRARPAAAPPRRPRRRRAPSSHGSRGCQAQPVTAVCCAAFSAAPESLRAQMAERDAGDAAQRGQHGAFEQHQSHQLRARGAEHAHHREIVAPVFQRVEQRDEHRQARDQHQHQAEGAQHVHADADHAEQARALVGGRGRLQRAARVHLARQRRRGERRGVLDQQRGDFLAAPAAAGRARGSPTPIRRSSAPGGRAPCRSARARPPP